MASIKLSIASFGEVVICLLFISTLFPNKKYSHRLIDICWTKNKMFRKIKNSFERISWTALHLVKRKYVCSMYQLLLEWISKYPLFSAFPQNTVGSKRMRDEILFDTCRRCNPWKRYILFIFRKSTIDWRICISSKHVSTTLEYIWY